MQEKPWTWGEDGKVTLKGPDEEPVEFQTIPTDPKKLVAFGKRLQLAEMVSVTLSKARAHFESGQADYDGAGDRIEALILEHDKVSRRQLAVAREVAMYFRPAGIADIFGASVDAITAFAYETVDQLQAAALKAEMAKKAEEPAPAPEAPPEQAETPEVKD